MLRVHTHTYMIAEPRILAINYLSIEVYILVSLYLFHCYIFVYWVFGNVSVGFGFYILISESRKTHFRHSRPPNITC